VLPSDSSSASYDKQHVSVYLQPFHAKLVDSNII